MRLFRLCLVAPVALLALSALVLTAPAAHAQVPVSFTGGNGTPLTFTLADPVTYTVSLSSAGAPLFVFKNVGDLFGTNTFSVTSTITFRINNGSEQAISSIRSGLNRGSVTPDDVYITASSIGSVTAGNIVTLSSGTLTTNSPVAAAAPASGLFTTFIANTGGTQLSSNGVSTPAAAVGPEPATLSLVGMGLLTGAGVFSRRREMAGSVRRRRKATKQAA